ncbi:ATPase [Bacillus sp. HMSC76G11]|uniref:Cadmium-translocating P-type ATPase n=1 Tax=Metabacillus idriensis TaxID=324768 RepID=A0A6I2MA48_9BACI|nr:heavy metal translocating P-type ATPase [Metabacillus idriensis]MRX53311.1 cadmium-translocating P-type ATPase [Metabacillus idriensis]OHR68639.1 ATPase [Bacillus sp. HMSC76G11]
MLVNENAFHQADDENTKFDRLKEYGELIAAILSGILILIGWAIQTNQGDSPAAVALFITAFLIGGYAKAKEGIEETLEERKLNVELLMVFAAVGSGIIGYWIEGAILIFIFALSGALETFTLNKSKRELSALMELQPEEASLLKDGKETKVHVSALEIGDLIAVRPGERIPTDGVVASGTTSIDQAAITGESIPVEKKTDELVFAGTVNINGSITVKVTKNSDETLFQKIIKLVQSAQSEKSPSQQFIERFEGTYVKGVLIAVALMMVLPHYLLGWSFNESFYRAMVLMVVASPCALVASITPATLSAISNGARNGLLFKGGVHLERLSKLKVIAFDKTGTLTKGEPVVTDVKISGNADEMDVFKAVLSIEKQSNHPLAKAITGYIEKKYPALDPEMLDVQEQSGFGVTAEWKGEMWSVGKPVAENNEENMMTAFGLEKAEEGKTIVYVKNDSGIAAVLCLQDVLRDDAVQAIDELKHAGIHTVMLTGDNESTAQSVANAAKVDQFIAECLPDDKVAEVKKLGKKYGHTAMIGDGINDAPALAAASVGIAMGEGTDVALETADVVLMKNDLTKLKKAIEVSRKMDKIIKQNIVFSMSVIALLICSNFLQVLDLPLGVIGHEGSTILVILNGLRLLR